MSSLNDIIQISVTRETQALTQAGFGTPAIISEFEASKTSVTFDRIRSYASLSEMLTDGWNSTDKVYLRAQAIFSQDPNPGIVKVGRKKPATEAAETWTEALAAIELADSDWYGFTIDSTIKAKVVFDADFVASNDIDFTVNGNAVTTVSFSSDQATTMGLLETQIESDITDSIVTIDGTDINNRTLFIEIENSDLETVTAVITGGVSQAVATVTFIDDDDILLAAAWAESAETPKLFFNTSNDAAVVGSGSTDIASQLKALNYDRSITCYHPNKESNNQFYSEAWIGLMFPKEPGSATWAYKNLSGITAYTLTGAERGYAIGTFANPKSGKNVNIYTTKAGVAITERGLVASGEWIDVIRGIDWLQARIQENVFSSLINTDKIPYTDEGVQIIAGLIREILNLGVSNGVLAESPAPEVTVPKVEDIADADKINRTLPDVTFTATLAGAIHAVQIAGTVSV